MSGATTVGLSWLEGLTGTIAVAAGRGGQRSCLGDIERWGEIVYHPRSRCLNYGICSCAGGLC